MRKIIEFESKTKIEIEHVRVKTKSVNEDVITNKKVMTVLECDAKAKEERIKCVRKNMCDNSLCIRNMVLQCGKETLEKSVSEVIK